MMKINSDALRRAAEVIASADGMLIGAGAGMGVDSGLPDFRGVEGFWRAYPALRSAGVVFEEIASPQAFDANPALAWGFYGHRLALYRNTVPHAGFALLRKWAERMPLGARVFTSNVDGQFQKDGFLPEHITECHGSIHSLQCSLPCRRAVWPAHDFVPKVDEANCLLQSAPPQCPYCGRLARPHIMMFGDWSWIDTPAVAAQHRLDAWLGSVERLVVVEIGAGTAIPSVRYMSQIAVAHYRAQLIRINPRESLVPPGHAGIAIGALGGLTAIDALLESVP